MLSNLKLGPRRLAQAEKLIELAKTRRVEILAHFYQRLEVKALAHFVGGTLGLHQAALNSQAQAIMICGVDFLAQNLARLRPDLKILVPRSDADCPFSQSVGPREVKKLRLNYPNHLLVADIKASGALRDLCDLEISPSGQFPANLEPDKALVLPARSTGQPGSRPWAHEPQALCQVHYQVTFDQVQKALIKFPGAKLAANSLCRPEVRHLADLVGDSQTIFEGCLQADPGDWLVICESGLVEWLNIKMPQSRFFEPDLEIFCPNMKLTNIKDMLQALEAELLAPERAPKVTSLTGQVG
ncbi:MAG: quinolinate synthase NadA [Deltaproteobacteria bacterium]|jgi:quinolinate synthase|nr:quinolinate synthase NadA [Deltaproteobacteria bacterium]